MSKAEDLSDLLRELRIDQRRRWTIGERRLAEEYFRQQPQLENHKEAALDFLYGEYCLREELGEAVDTQEYLRRFPQFEIDLKRLFEVHQAMDLGSLQDTAIVPKASKTTREHPNCPVCHNPVDSVGGDDNQDLVCPTCGNSFRVASEQLQTWHPDALPTLGKFKLVEVVGRGAFGTVYRGHDTELKRTVAVKVPRSGQLSTSEDEDRFVREARNAAQLQHAGIVPVFEVGHAGGFPYLVSEFVEGVTLGDVITSRRLGFREAATLLCQVAQAVEHAHSRGVIHRDLKPPNIMITPQGAARVMDFGLAKRDAGEVTMTTDGTLLGTPAYMSPEQASGLAHHLDARSDVYSLGVILYQLITGELPFRGNQRMILHQVQHDEPRGPRSLNDRIPRDLATICMKAMAKDPARRYTTAQELADDLDRFLSGQPILARPVGPVDRAWRWCKRNSIVASLAASILLLLSFGAIAATVGLVITNRLRLEAEASAAVAQTKSAEAVRNAEEAERIAKARDAIATQEVFQRKNAEQVNQFLVGLFRSADPMGLGEWGFREKMEPLKDLTAIEVVRRGVHQLDTLKDQPQLHVTMMDTLGSVLSSLGDAVEAERLLEQTLTYRRTHATEDPLALASTLNNLGSVHYQVGHYEQAERLYREALELQKRKVGDDSLLVADTEFALARVVADLRREGLPGSEEVEPLIRDVLRIRKKHLTPDDRQLAIAFAALAAVQFGKAEDVQAALALAQAIRIFEKHEGTKSVSAAVAAVARVDIERRRGNFTEALRISREAVERLEPVLGPNHPIMAIAVGNLAARTRDAGDQVEAERLGRRAMDIGRHTTMRGHPKMIAALVEFGDMIFLQAVNSADVDFVERRLADAQEMYEEAIVYLREGHSPQRDAEITGIQDRLARLRETMQQKLSTVAK